MGTHYLQSQGVLDFSGFKHPTRRRRCLLPPVRVSSSSVPPLSFSSPEYGSHMYNPSHPTTTTTMRTAVSNKDKIITLFTTIKRAVHYLRQYHTIYNNITPIQDNVTRFATISHLFTTVSHLLTTISHLMPFLILSASTTAASARGPKSSGL